MNVCDGEAYLAEAFESVLAQTFSDWELIFWDDRSVDGSAAVYRRYEEPRFRHFVSAERRGLGAARIQAITSARGQWLAFLDQDDVWTPTKLADQLALVEGDHAGGIGLVYGRAIRVNPSGRLRIHDHRHEFEPLPEGRILNRLLIDSCYIAMSTVLVRASAYHAVGGFPEDLRYAIDYHLYLALAQRYEARALQAPCCFYREHAASISSTRAREVHAEVVRILDSLNGAAALKLLDQRRRVHESLIAVEDLKLGRIGAGLHRVLMKGSAAYLLTRPAARLFRCLRRAVAGNSWEIPAMPTIRK